VNPHYQQQWVWLVKELQQAETNGEKVSQFRQSVSGAALAGKLRGLCVCVRVCKYSACVCVCACPEMLKSLIPSSLPSLLGASDWSHSTRRR